ncbi:MAG: alcohol dehydrogenase catalytic domain-containing protein [Armatimonadota bacterium]
MTYNIPQTQQAVQLTGPDELTFNKQKSVVSPGSHQILCRVEAVGLCFSDLKLLKQFSAHPRKKLIVSGIDTSILDEIPSYVPGELPTVPGHETVIRIVEVGADVEGFKPGERYLVQTDYRWLPTDGSNASFGYDFEGGLQEYVLMDTRIITSPDGESMLIPASEEVSASAVALVEPWACVENSYASQERQSLDMDGQTLIVSDIELNHELISNFFESYGYPEHITIVSSQEKHHITGAVKAESLESLSDILFDDIIYFGSNPATVESLFSKIATHGILNLVQCGGKFGRPVMTAVGRVHYGGIRIIGTEGCDPSASMQTIPVSGEIRPGDRINVVGAGGPMGMMHVIRDICQGIEGVSVFAGDLNADRLGTLAKIASPLAEGRGVSFASYNPNEAVVSGGFSYTALMVPVPALVSQAIGNSLDNGIINIFAGIPAQTVAEIDLDTYVTKKLYFIGTSGSVLEDMKTVLSKVENARQLDTNLSVAAISGLDGAIQGIRAVEHQLLAGKIIVYPQCEGMGLIPLDDLAEKLPEVAEYLKDGLWTIEAENQLLKKYSYQKFE